jgi:AbrB family looped-hinge helix DNA binding protein
VLGAILVAQEVDMSHTPDTIEGTISSKYQITIPAAMRDVLGLRPGDKIEFNKKPL